MVKHTLTEKDNGELKEGVQVELKIRPGKAFGIVAAVYSADSAHGQRMKCVRGEYPVLVRISEGGLKAWRKNTDLVAFRKGKPN